MYCLQHYQQFIPLKRLYSSFKSTGIIQDPIFTDNPYREVWYDINPFQCTMYLSTVQKSTHFSGEWILSPFCFEPWCRVLQQRREGSPTGDQLNNDVMTLAVALEKLHLYFYYKGTGWREKGIHSNICDKPHAFMHVNIHFKPYLQREKSG